jgi:hypothetical protein
MITNKHEVFHPRCYCHHRLNFSWLGCLIHNEIPEPKRTNLGVSNYGTRAHNDVRRLDCALLRIALQLAKLGSMLVR